MATMNGIGLNGPHSSIANNTSGDSLSGLGSKEDVLKSQFSTREGVYRNMAAIEFRPNRVGYTTPTTNTPVRVSFVTMTDPLGLPIDRICFNVGRELFVYNYIGVKQQTMTQVTDHNKPVDKRVYKGTFPTCHDFCDNSITPDGVYLLIGFSAGQIQLIDPLRKEYNKLFNEERLIEKSKVTCIKWAPNSTNTFLVSHASGSLYVYQDELTCGTTPPHYQLTKQGDFFAVYSCKSKSPRNPTTRWLIGEGSLNEFSFSPCGKLLATVSQDGFMRVFDYESMELVGRMRSYFGGLHCLAWSPDGRFIVTGGEDDLITFWSVAQKRVVARGQGHKSWVSVVTFDPFTTSITDGESVDDVSDSESSAPFVDGRNNSHGPAINRLHSRSSISGCETPPVTSYRIGSVGQDAHLCLWELSDDVLRQPVGRSRASILIHNTSISNSIPVPSASSATTTGNSIMSTTRSGSCSNTDALLALTSNSNSITNTITTSNTTTTATTTNAASLASNSCSAKSLDNNNAATSQSQQPQRKDHKRNFSLGSRNNDKNSVNKMCHKISDDPVRLLGTPCCPRLTDVPILEPLICKKISQERLTSLVFREDCFVTACQEGFVSTWARPGRALTTAPLVPEDCDPGLEADAAVV